jgi:poly(hydroxyalkanoate) depolymerase family esterase
MNAVPKIDMAEVTRLTREGRLGQAMAVLRAALPVASPSAAHSGPAEGTQQGPSQATAPMLDMTPPSAGAGSAWSSASSGEASADERSQGTGRSQIPEALRGFLARASRSEQFESLIEPSARKAPARLPYGAKFDERSFANAAGSRAYKIYVPSGYRGQAVPLVVMLHGCTQSPDDFAAGTGMNEVAEEHTFLVAYPAQSQAANTSRCWNWFKPGDQQRHQGEPALIAGITRQIMEDFSVAPGRVYIAGLSAGGAAAAIMGATYPDLYAAIGVHSGLACGAARDMPSAFTAMRQGGSSAVVASPNGSGVLPTIVFHGDRDTTVNPVNGAQVIAQSAGAGDLSRTVSHGKSPAGMRYTRTVQADASGRTVTEHWVLHGAGHAWSGGSSAGTYTEPRGPDASREMLRFFLQHAN